MFANFGLGNLVAVRVGDGTGSLSSTAAPVFLDEFSPAGSAIQSIALPTAVSGSNHMLTLGGSSVGEGALNLSSNGKYLTLAGYDAEPGTANVATTASSTVNRVVARVDASGLVDTTTAMNDGYTGGTTGIRSAVTDDGTRFWTGGQAGSGLGLGGVRYVSYGNSTSSTALGTAPNNRPNNVRVVEIFNNQLYVSLVTGMITLTGVATFGTGLPTTTQQSTFVLPNFSGAGDLYGFVMLDRNASIAGLDTLYVADQGVGLLKYSFDGANWNARGGVAGSLTGIAAAVRGNVVDVYATSGTGGGNTIVKLTDTAAFDADLTDTFTTIATAASNTAFRGLAFAPQGAPPTPNVTSIARAASNPTNASSVAYTVTFNTPVTGVDQADFSVTPTGISNAGVTNVTGSGTTYTVTVNTGSGDGTLKLNLADDDSIVNSDGVPLGGTGSGNGSFTIGELYTIDKTRPTVTIDQAPTQADPTTSSTINVTVVFSEAVSDFATGDVTLSGTAGAGSAAVSGSGTTYNVAITGMTGAGTVIVSLAAGVATDSAGNLSFASTSIDNTVTFQPLSWHNAADPGDVDELNGPNGLDLQYIIEALNVVGSVYLPDLTVPLPNPTKKVDVDGDNRLNGLDLQTEIAILNTPRMFAPPRSSLFANASNDIVTKGLAAAITYRQSESNLPAVNFLISAPEPAKAQAADAAFAQQPESDELFQREPHYDLPSTAEDSSRDQTIDLVVAWDTLA